ncbi:MAG: DUF1553 domain-containing protein [Gemmataceae bacterium]|nr:DUF1553 domain-containing protein [Gemmataceae bacterium]
MIRRYAIAMLVVLSATVTASAGADSWLSFEAEILPILNAHCLQCHGGVHQKNELDLRTHAALLIGGKSGTAVVPGKPDESLLWKKIARDEMPKTDNKVSEANKKLIRAWIEGGAKGKSKAREINLARPAMKPTDVAKLIDREIDARLSRAKIPASPRSTDAEFLRRVYLDITGKLPEAEVTKAFLGSADAEQRARLIDKLLASEEYGRHFAERWVNLFRQMSVNESEWDRDRFQGWMAEQFSSGKGWDATVREMYAVSGFLADKPQTAFYYYNADMQGKFEPKIMVGNLSQVFLGVQLQCAECHHHPFSNYKQNDFWGLAAFFSGTSTPNNPPNTRAVRDNLPKQAPKAGTQVAITIPKGEARNAGTRVRAKFLGGEEPNLDAGASFRPPLAAWLTAKDNRLFARASVNRLWAQFFARGFVNPLNDFGDHNAPSHPDLLDALAEEFVVSRFDHKHLIRSICLSDAYQRTSHIVKGNEKAEAEPLFARMASKVLTPEELYDALCVALEVPEIAPPVNPKKKPNLKGPQPPSPRSQFVKFFRNPGEVDEPTELKLGVPHVLKLMNEANFNTGGKVVERVMASAKTLEETIDGLFIAVLARPATPAERERFAAFVARQASPREAYDRVVWVLINSTGFVLNH